MAISTPLVRIPPSLASLGDYEPMARDHLNDNAWAYLSGGAADEITLRENITAFDRIKFISRVLRPLASASTQTRLLGQTFEAPLFIAPVAHQKLFHPHGESAMALGASAMNTGMVLSTLSSVSMEEVARVSSAPLWFQLYFQPEREATRALVERAHIAGYRAIVATIDTPVSGMRNREQRIQFQLPPGLDAANLRSLPGNASQQPALGAWNARPGSVLFGPALDTSPTWEDIRWLRAQTSLPILLKGILHPADAALAVESGANGIIVSNHGGRNLDTLPASIEALPAVVAAVEGKIPVLLDGGIRRGTDILKALALGAQAVLIGRPANHALAVAGAVGVAHVLKILRAEMEAAMSVLGCASLDQIDSSILWHPPLR